MALADYAVPADTTRRRYDEADTGEEPFRLDCERILRCSAFRRLDFKTQVFVPHEHDHFRTRLTHTLEVAQVARKLARAVGANEDLVEAVALAHDLGHPPFGHAGEAALNELLADHGHFEHNRQSLRVVDTLEHPYPDFRGLNLTDVTRECIARHESRYDTPVCDDFHPGLWAPLEGQLVDLADEIAYTTADLEDALTAGWLTESRLADQPLWQMARQRAQQRYPQARPIHLRIQANKALLDILCEQTIARTRANLAAATVHSVRHVQHASARMVALTEELAGPLERLGQLLFNEVYQHPANVTQDRQAREILIELFAAYRTDPSRLPQRYARRIAEQGLHRVVCDYIAGMTDRYCRNEHARLCTPAR
jgi:dGTPase